MFEAVGAADEGGVGDGVRGAGEEIGEGDRPSHVAWKDPEGQVEGAADPPGWGGKQVVRPPRLGSASRRLTSLILYRVAESAIEDEFLDGVPRPGALLVCSLLLRQRLQ